MARGQTGGWSDDHEDDAPAAPDAGEMIWERPRTTPYAPFVPRLGIGGATEEGTLTYALPLLRRFIDAGASPLVIGHNADRAGGWTRVERLRETLRDTLDAARITVVTTDPGRASTALFKAVATELAARFPDASILLLIGGSDVAPVILSPMLVHYAVGVLDLTATPQPPPAALVATDCLMLHAPGATTPTMSAAISRVVVGRGHLPTPIVSPTSAGDLDAVFTLVWADLIGEPLRTRAPSSALPE